MKILSVFVIALAIFGCSACSKKTAPVTEKKKTDSVVAQQPAKVDSVAPVNQRFIVTFYSIGSGTERDQITAFEKFVADYGQKNNTTITYEKAHWGREGEVNYCMMLTEISAMDQQKFIAEAGRESSGRLRNSDFSAGNFCRIT